MLILASASPRRQELLRQIGVEFQCCVSDAVEDQRDNQEPAQLAMENALLKAKSVAARQSAGALVLGADTVVYMDGHIYGKPQDEADALRMLHLLSGKTHEVYTGIALVAGTKYWRDVEKTKVKMASMTAEQIRRYAAGGEPLDKAGAYAIQGRAAMFIEGIEGSYSNVVGLPLYQLGKLAEKAGVDLRCRQ